MTTQKRTKKAVPETGKRTSGTAKSRANARKAGSPTPCRVPLRTVEHVRVQLARLYREARMGALPSSEATRFAYLLGQLRVTIADGTIETRLTEAERQLSALLARLPK